MPRTLAFLAVLGLAGSAYGLPVTYGFSSPYLGSGVFSYDGDTGLGTLALTVSPVVSVAPFPVSISAPATVIDGASEDSLFVSGEFPTWPSVPSRFPLVSGYVSLRIRGADLFTDEHELRGDLTYSDGLSSDLTAYQSWVEMYGSTCPLLDTAPEDCPVSSFPFASDYTPRDHLTEIHPVPETHGFGALAMLLTVTILCAKRA